MGGIKDRSVVPVRGQIVVVRNSPGGIFSISGTDDGPDESAYIMTRAAGGGTILRRLQPERQLGIANRP